MSRWWDSAAVLAVMFCAAEALYTVHQETASFNGALKACLTDGFLTSMADQKENERILSSVSASLNSAGSFNFWVGLRKPAGTCDQEDPPLYGFVWTSSNSRNSGVNQWIGTPIRTCTNERCGLLSLVFDGGKVTSWGWIDSSCTKAHRFICKKQPGRSPPPDVPGDGSPCSDRRTPCGKPQPPPRPPHMPTVLPSPGPSPSHSPEERISTPSLALSLTSSSSVTTQIQDSTSDKYKIFIPVLVALLVLVVLVVVVLAVFKCCFKKKPKKASNSKNRGKREVTVDLSATDLDRDETTA